MEWCRVDAMGVKRLALVSSTALDFSPRGERPRCLRELELKVAGQLVFGSKHHICRRRPALPKCKMLVVLDGVGTFVNRFPNEWTHNSMPDQLTTPDDVSNEREVYVMERTVVGILLTNSREHLLSVASTFGSGIRSG